MQKQNYNNNNEKMESKSKNQTVKYIKKKVSRWESHIF